MTPSWLFGMVSGMRKRDLEQLYAVTVEALSSTAKNLAAAYDERQRLLDELKEVRDRERDTYLRLFTDLDPRPTRPDLTAELERALADNTPNTALLNQPTTGPLPPTPTAWGAPERDAADYEDPIDLSQPLDYIPLYEYGEPEGWGLDEEVPLGEPVPEGQREKIVGIAPGENPFEGLGIKRADEQ